MDGRYTGTPRGEAGPCRNWEQKNSSDGDRCCRPGWKCFGDFSPTKMRSLASIGDPKQRDFDSVSSSYYDWWRR